MNVYHNLNRVTEKIEEGLENEVDYNALSRMLGVNAYTMQRIFRMLTGLTLTDYIRRRRLSVAGQDLMKGDTKVIDVAMKYGYDNATSFSRAFLKFHGVKPSEVTAKTRLKNFPRITFKEEVETARELDYEVVDLPAMTLYGVSQPSSNRTIRVDAPDFFEKTEAAFGPIDYGMLTYDDERQEVQKYYCLYARPKAGFEEVKLPAAKWLKFDLGNCETKAIQDLSQKFYFEFLPDCHYNLRKLPELEHYHDGKMDFLVAID